MIRDGFSGQVPLAPAPTSFFMTLRDVAFWMRSARADSRLNRAARDAGTGPAFDQLYGATADPYGSELPQYRYQQRKYDSLLSMLPRRPYRRILDIGCGLGAFTRKLAPFGGQVVGTDISAEAVRQARQLSTGMANIEYSQANLLDAGGCRSEFDLIVLADTLYYVDPLTESRLKAIARNVALQLAPGGLLLLVNHYFFGLDGASRCTVGIHGAFRWAADLKCLAEHRRAFFLATLLQRSYQFERPSLSLC